MKKALLAVAAMAMASTFSIAAANQYGCTPPEGEINLEAYPSGISSIEISANAIINRDAEGFATLSKDGQVLKSIPASNQKMVYCFYGFDRVEEGSIHITFFDRQETTPTKESGRYRVTIPSGFFTVNGQPNKPLVYNFMIQAPSTVDLDVVPAAKSQLNELTTVTVTIPDAESISFVDTTSTQVVNDPETGEDVTQTEYAAYIDPMFGTDGAISLVGCQSIEGNKVTFTLPNKLVGTGLAYFCLRPGTLVAKMKDGSTRKNAEVRLQYTMSKATGAFTISPAPGSYKEIPSQDFSAISNNGKVWGYFKVDFPEGVSYNMLMTPSAKLVDEKGTAAYSFAIEQTKDKKSFLICLKSYQGGNAVYSQDPLTPAAGTYTIKVTGKYFINGGNYTDLPAEFGPFVFTGSENVAQYTLSPSADEVLTEIKDITLTFDADAKVEWKKSAYATILNGPIEYDILGSAKDNVASISLPAPIDVPGTYSLEIPAGTLTVNGKSMPAITAEYKVERPYVKDLTINADNGGEIGNCVFIENDEEYGPVWRATAIFKEGETPAVTLTIPSGYDRMAYLNQTVPNMEEDRPQRRISSSDLSANGFTVNNTGVIDVLYKGENPILFSFGSNDTFVTPTGLILTVDIETGVEGIEAEESAEYYTLQGVKVANPENGIYIKVAGGKAVKVVL